MKTLNVTFEDADFATLEQKKEERKKQLGRNTYSWEAFILDMARKG
jgi:hypothetical protein